MQRWPAEMARLALGVNCGGLEKRKSGLPSLLLAFLNHDKSGEKHHFCLTFFASFLVSRQEMTSPAG